MPESNNVLKHLTVFLFIAATSLLAYGCAIQSKPRGSRSDLVCEIPFFIGKPTLENVSFRNRQMHQNILRHGFESVDSAASDFEIRYVAGCNSGANSQDSIQKIFYRRVPSHSLDSSVLLDDIHLENEYPLTGKVIELQRRGYLLRFSFADYFKYKHGLKTNGEIYVPERAKLDSLPFDTIRAPFTNSPLFYTLGSDEAICALIFAGKINIYNKATGERQTHIKYGFDDYDFEGCGVGWVFFSEGKEYICGWKYDLCEF